MIWNLSFSLSESGVLKENCTGNKFFSIRSPLIDFYVCLKPERMVACVLLFEKKMISVHNHAETTLADCGEGSRRKGERGDKRARASRSR